MNPFPPIHTEEALRSTRALVRRRRKSWCEMVAPAGTSGGFGESSSAARVTARLRCAISQASRPGEVAAGDDVVSSITEYEFAFAWGVVVEPGARLAVPANFPKWKKDSLYAVGMIVAPLNWVSGKTEVYKCVRAGVSGAVEPAWKRRGITSETLPEDSLSTPALWSLAGRASLYEVVAVNDVESNPAEVVVRAKELN